MLGYNQVFMDPRHVNIMKSSGAPVLVDITHPNKNYPGNTKNNSETLGQSYIAAGADGIFLEAHPKCDQAKCDADTMLDINQLPELISKLYKTKEHFDELFS
jgi:2-dehydro-3-deoxyphosphooctonate aldolase (KDO 8-P synthase)